MTWEKWRAKGAFFLADLLGFQGTTAQTAVARTRAHHLRLYSRFLDFT